MDEQDDPTAAGRVGGLKPSHQTARRMAFAGLGAALILCVAAPAALAQVPPDIAAANRAIGKRTDVEGTAKLYAPLAERPPYSEATATRDLSYGPDEKNKLDVFAPAPAARGRLPVVIHLSGGENARQILPGAPFYDNVMLWAVKHGMIGVSTGRRLDAKMPWATGAEDVALMVKWVHDNIAKYGGDPNRIYFVAHAYGGTDVAKYLAHKEFWTAPTHEVAGVAFISTPFNIEPLIMPPPGRDGAVNPMADPAHSDLEGLKALNIPLFLSVAEMDPDNTHASDKALRDALCARQGQQCPPYMEFKDHQHISVMFSFNTPDESVSGPVLQWLRSLR